METIKTTEVTTSAPSREEIARMVEQRKMANKEIGQALEAMERTQRLQSERVKYYMPKVSYSAI